ncbi:lytic transglycosylase domain-containing protein [Paraburkholderia terrae]|uniref:lytic transglycosylase domain-containing protein n=1 Tax=Paraburkholderia terrae TaxID=311230 RepID=UPI001EE1F18F|nr:lytic transglycosylase domain-containing protein [Paraburkholderia terrae]GJH02276.1 hypothetical protein CBA19C8_16985 [Paraburkholderia terrae]
MAAENQKGVLSIPVNTDEFDDFVKRWTAYQEDVKTSASPFDKYANELRDAVAAAGELNAQLAHTAQVTSTSKMVGQNSYSAQLARNTHATMQDWKQTDKYIESSNKNFASFARNWLSISPLRKGFLGIGGAALGIAGAAITTANDLANDNRRNRELGLKPGELPAFNNDFKKYGLSDADIERTRDAQNDQSKWRTFVAAGLSPLQAQAMDPIDLTAYLDKWAGSKVREWNANGQPIGSMSKAYGLDNFYSQNQLRLAGSYSDEEHDESLRQFRNDVPKFAIDQKTEDEATEQQRQWNNTWTKITRDFETSFMTLTPEIAKIGRAFGDAADAFLRSPEIKQDLNDLADGLDDVVKFFRFAKKTNADPANNPDSAARDTVHQFGLRVLDGVKQSYRDISGYLTGKPPTQPAPPTTSKDSTPAMWKEWMNTATKKFGLPDGLQNFQMRIESRGNPNAVNPVTGAAGLMQFMPDTAKQMGIDPFDPKQSIFGNAALMDRYHGIYGTWGKSLAAYDGDTHISADEKRYRSWLMGAKPETLNYERAAYDSGIDLGLSDEEVKYLLAHSKPWKGTTNDSKLKAKNGLDESQFQVIDLSQEGKAGGLTQQQISSAVREGTFDAMSRFVSLFKEGGGASLRSGDTTRRERQSNGQGPAHVVVEVMTPPGFSVNTKSRAMPR